MRPSCPSRIVGIATAVLLITGPVIGPFGLAEEDEPMPWTVEHEVHATVQDHYAQVRVGATIEAQAAGGSFSFEVPVPDDAYVSGLTITRNGTVHEAEIQPREQARDTYEQAQREQRSAALVEDVRGESLYRYDVNLAPRQTVEVELVYERYLSGDEGYDLELVAPATPRAGDEGASFDVRLHHTRGITAVHAARGFAEQDASEGRHLVHEVGPRQPGNATRVNLTYHVAASPPGGDLVATVHNGTGYFAHRIQADTEQAQLPVDLALVLDRSGSMSGAKIDQVRTATRELVDHLDAEDRLHLTTFSGSARSAWQGLAPVDQATTTDVRDRLDAMDADGSTNVAEAIREGMGPFGAETPEDRFPAVAFLTDGKATAGVTSDDQLRALAEETNTAQAHVFGLAFGASADWSLIHGLAEDADGYAERVPVGQGADIDLERFLTRLGSPVLGNVTVDYEHDDVRSWRLGAPVAFAGEELVHVGTFDPNLTHLNATVRAETADGSLETDLAEPVPERGPDWLPRLVGHQRVQELEDRLDARGSDEEIEAQIEQLSLAHGFVTSQTSLVVDLPRTSPLDQSTSAATEVEQVADGSGVDRDAAAPADDPTGAEQAAETPGVGLSAGVAVLAAALMAYRSWRPSP